MKKKILSLADISSIHTMRSVDKFSDDKLTDELEKNVIKIQNSQDLSWKSRCEKVLEDLSFVSK